MKKLLIIFTLICSICFAKAQSWTNVGNGLDSTINFLATYNGKLVATGNFSHSGTDSIYNLGFYNGMDWAGPDSNLYTPPTYSMLEFNDTLYAVGLHELFYWNNYNWISIATIMDCYWFSKFIVYKNHLYLSGMSNLYRLEHDTIDNVACTTDGGWIEDLCIYKNILFIGGCFMDIGHHIAGFDGTNIINITAPFTDSDNVEQMATYNGILYIGGHFDSLQPKYLYQYDGIDFTPATYQPNEQPALLDSMNGKLFIYGDITNIGSQSVNRIAYWDGFAWTDAGQGFSPLFTINTITEYDSAVYIGGDFIFNNGISQTNYIARFNSSPSSIDQNSAIDHAVFVYPNPATNYIILETGGIFEIEMYTMTGLIILRQQLPAGQNSLDISELKAGIYIIKLKNNTRTETIKFVKE